MGSTTFNAANSVYFNTSAMADAGGNWNAMLYAGQVSGNQRCGVKFNLTGLANKTITKATLRVYYERGSAPFNFNLAASNSIDFTSYRATQAGSNQLISDIGGVSSRALGITTDLVGWREVDVTDFAEQMYSDKVCFYIYSTDTNPSGFLRLSGAAKDARPQLVLEWRENASTFTLNKNTVAIGVSNDLQVTINAANSSYQHRITFVLGDLKTSVWNKTGGGSITGSIDNSYANKIPNSTNATGSVIFETLSSDSSTVLGSSSQSLIFTVPNDSTFFPTLTFDQPTSSTSAKNVNYANYTTWSASATASGKYNASITQTVLTLKRSGTTTYTASYGSSFSNVYIPVQSAGSYTWEVKATDSRGFSISQQYSMKVVTYTPIYFSNVAITRTDKNGASAVEGKYYKLSGNVISSLAITSVKADIYSASLASNTTNYSLANINGGNACNTNQDNTLAKTITITATDGVKTISMNITLPSAQYIFYFKKGGGALGIGKAASATADGWLDIGWKTQITNSDGAGILSLAGSASKETSIYFEWDNGNAWAIGRGCGDRSAEYFTLFSRVAGRNVFTTTSTNANFYGYSFRVSNPSAVLKDTTTPANGHVAIFADNEGGNFEIVSNDDYKIAYQLDAYNGSLRLFSHPTTGTTEEINGIRFTGFTFDGKGTLGSDGKYVGGAFHVPNLTASTLSLETALAVKYGGTGATTAGDARTNLNVYSKAETDNVASYYPYIIKSYNGKSMDGTTNFMDLSIQPGKYMLEFDDSGATNSPALPSDIKRLTSDRCVVTIWASFQALGNFSNEYQYRVVDVYSFTKRKTYRLRYWWSKKQNGKEWLTSEWDTY